MQQSKKSKPTPMPPFGTINEAVVKLAAYVHVSIMETTCQDNRVDLIKKSVDNTVFRGFAGVSSPSTIYREWVKNEFSNIHKELQRVGTQSAYDKIIVGYSYKLIDWWSEKCGSNNLRIGFGPASKMVNLLVKTIQQYENERIKGLESYMHVPFDLYTLAPMRLIINDLADVRYNIPIRPTSTMNFVVNEELYQVLQGAVRKLSEQANREPIIFDYMCWNSQH
jgi:hypothetical protein